MAIAFLLDENTESALMGAVVRCNARGIDTIDVVRVGQAGIPPRGTSDPDLLLWAEENARILVTRDRATMPLYFAQHLAAGRHVPGILMLRRGISIDRIISALQLIAYASSPEEWVDRIYFIE